VAARDDQLSEDAVLGAALDDLGRAGTARGLALHGAVVQRLGDPPVERRWTLDARRDVQSVSKTVVALAVGLAEAEGALHREHPVDRYLPELAGPGTGGVTVDSLVRMTSGLTWRWTDPDADHPGDPARDVLGAPPITEPGTAFAYRGGNTYLACRVLAVATGSDVRDFLVPRLLGPLGIDNPQWHRCPLGHSLGATGLFLRTRELARIGALLLDGGRWAGHQVLPPQVVSALPADWVDAADHRPTGAAQPHPDSARYGRGVWACARDGAWRMDGIHGQLCIVLPRHRACVTVTAEHTGPTSDVLDAVWDHVVTALPADR